ncbi:hypothetical protein V8G54_006869, partial [Vigna mungo]
VVREKLKEDKEMSNLNVVSSSMSESCRCDELVERSKKDEMRCAELELKLKKKDEQCEALEAKLRALEGEVEVLRVSSEGLFWNVRRKSIRVRLRSGKTGTGNWNHGPHS